MLLTIEENKCKFLIRVINLEKAVSLMCSNIEVLEFVHIIRPYKNYIAPMGFLMCSIEQAQLT